MVKKKKEELNINQIIAKNFFIYLDKKGISQRQYAKDNFLNAATISNWKNGTGAMSAEHIKQAADYFEITVNDLYYDKDEKKKIEILSDKNYHPSMAQQTVETRLLNESFNKPFGSMVTVFTVFAVFIAFSFLLVKKSVYWSLMIIPPFISVYLFYENDFGYKKTFIVNYLDDIYYYNENADKISKKVNILINSLILVLHILGLMSLLYSYKVSSGEEKLIVIIFAMLISSFIIFFVSMFSMCFKYKKKMYETEFSFHLISVILMTVSIALLGFSITLLNFGFIKHILFFIATVLITILSIINYYIICVNYRGYSLVYENEKKEIEKLFI